MYRLLFIIVFFVFQFNWSATAQIKFSKFYDNNTYGNRISDQGHDFVVLNDSGYLFPSFSTNLYSVDTLGYAVSYLQIIRTKSNGDTIYRKVYRIKNHSISVKYIAKMNETSYLLAGYIFDLVKYDKDSTGAEVLLVKINIDGDTLWTKTVGIGDGDELVTRIVKTKDGGYAIFGQTCDKKETNCDYYLMKVDSNGNKQWHKKYSLNSNSWEMPFSMIETNEGGFLMGGYTSDIYRSFLIKVDSLGNKEWSRSFPTFQGFLYRIITDVFQSGNNTYLITGVADKSSGQRIGFFTRINSSGSILLDKQVGNPMSYTALLSIIERDNIIYLQGETQEYLKPNETGYHTLLYAYTSSGNTLWRRIYPDSLLKNKRYLIYKMKPTLDNGFAMIGWGMDPKATNPQNSQDVWLLKVDSMGCLYDPCLDMAVGVNEERMQTAIKIYPNPTSGMLKIETEDEVEEIVVYNLLGQKVFEKNNLSEKEINISGLHKGIYLVKIIATNGLEFTERIVKE